MPEMYRILGSLAERLKQGMEMKGQKEFSKENRKYRRLHLEAGHVKQQQAFELQKLKYAKQQQAILCQTFDLKVMAAKHAKQKQTVR